MPIYKPPRIKPSPNGTPIVELAPPQEFDHLIGQRLEDIILFDNGTDKLLEEGRTILPRYYFIFEGNKDGDVQFKPYEYNKYRIVVRTYKGVITDILSIG